MTIRFAPAKRGPKVADAGPMSSLRARALRRRCVERVANDNCPGAELLAASQKQLEAALRHFAEHGLDAPRAARANAEAALAAGDSEGHKRWAGIAGTFVPKFDLRGGPLAYADDHSTGQSGPSDIA